MRLPPRGITTNGTKSHAKETLRWVEPCKRSESCMAISATREAASSFPISDYAPSQDFGQPRVRFAGLLGYLVLGQDNNIVRPKEKVL